jgi:hypothetical protein
MSESKQTPTQITIESVKIVPGSELVRYWKSKMQVIQTDKGTFIDNMPGIKFTKNPTAHSGFDWKQFEGQKVNNFQIIDYIGFEWINKE